MKETLARLLAANQGKWIPGISAFITGGLTQLITSKGFELPGEVATLLATTTALMVGWLFQTMLAQLNREGVRAIQEALPGIKTTGQATAGTVAMVERLADRIKAPNNSPVHALTISEAMEIKRLLHQICRDRPELLAELRSAAAVLTPDASPQSTLP